MTSSANGDTWKRSSTPCGLCRRLTWRLRQPPDIARVNGRAKEGRLLKRIRKGILDALSAQGGEPSIVHHSLTERAAWLEFNVPYVQNNFRAFDITQLRILKDPPAAGPALVNFLFDRSTPPKFIELHAADH